MPHAQPLVEPFSRLVKAGAAAMLSLAMAGFGMTAAIAQPATTASTVASATSRLPWFTEAVDVAGTQFFAVKVSNFTLSTGVEGNDASELWAANRTGATRLLSVPRNVNSNSSIVNLVSRSGQTYFLASEFESNFHQYRALWTSDGTVQGTKRVAGFGQDGRFQDVQELRMAGGNLTFFCYRHRNRPGEPDGF